MHGCFNLLFCYFLNQILSTSLLLRCFTARGSSTMFFLVGPAKVKAHNSILFPEKFPGIENKEHSVGFVITFILLSLCFNALHSSKSSQYKSVTKMLTGFLRATKLPFCSIRLNGLLAKYEKYRTLSIHFFIVFKTLQ